MVDSRRSIVHDWSHFSHKDKDCVELDGVFLQWLLGTGSVNTTTRSDASNAMHTDQVRKKHSIVSSWSGMKLFQLVSIKFLKCSYCLQG